MTYQINNQKNSYTFHSLYGTIYHKGVMRMKKPTDRQKLDWWVILAALVGLGIAVSVFYLVIRWLVFTGNTVAETKDIISITATVLGSFVIGAMAVMQYRKYLWEKNQARLDAGAKRGERLSKALEHLGDIDSRHRRSGACYELKFLAEDFPEKEEAIRNILEEFIKSRVVTQMVDLAEGKYKRINAVDIIAAARVFASLQDRNWKRHNALHWQQYIDELSQAQITFDEALAEGKHSVSASTCDKMRASLDLFSKFFQPPQGRGSG